MISDEQHEMQIKLLEIKKVIYRNANCEKFKIPKKFYSYYFEKPEPTDKPQLKRLEYLNLLEFFVNADVHLNRGIYLGEEDRFKGTGYCDDKKIAFFGNAFGSTKQAIDYKEFRKRELSRVEILTLNEEVNSYIEYLDGIE